MRILLAEDNPINQVAVVRALHRLGHEVDAVSNGEDAIEAILSTSYRLALVDCQLAGMDAYQAVAEIRRREDPERRTPIVAMTANALDTDRAECLAAGMDDYFAKPVRFARLAAMVERWTRLPTPLVQ